jgi:Flp pilus assembly protein TadG
MREKRAPNYFTRSKQPAQALIEIALLLPIVLLLVLGSIDFGRMFITRIVLTNAAREGANYLAYYPEDKGDGYSATYARIMEEVANSGLVDPATVVIDAPINCCTEGEYVEITVRVDNINLMFGDFYTRFFSNDGVIDISRTVRMMVQ